MAYQDHINEPESTDTSIWLKCNGLESLIGPMQQNGLILEILVFVEEPELNQLCQYWKLDTATKIKFLSAIRKLKQSHGQKDIVIFGEEQQQTLDNLFNEKAKTKHYIDQYRKLQNDLEHDAHYTKKQIHSSCDDMIQIIEKYRKQLSNDIHSKKEQRSNTINRTLEQLHEAFDVISTTYKQCQDIATDDQKNMSSELQEMNNIAIKYDTKSLHIDSTNNAHLSLKYDKNMFREHLEQNVMITFEVDEKGNQGMYNNVLVINQDKIKEHEVLKFNSNFKSVHGIVLSENDRCCHSHTETGSDVWIVSDTVPVTKGRHCWRIQTINPMKKYVMWGLSEMKMYDKVRSNDTIYGITNRNTYWPFNPNIVKRDQVALSQFMGNDFEIDIFLDCNKQMVKLCVVGNDNDDNNAWIMLDDQLNGIGWVPHFELEGCLDGPKLSVCKIPMEWYGKKFN